MELSDLNKIFSSNQGTLWKRIPEGKEDTKKTRPSNHCMTDAHMNVTDSSVWLVQGLYGFVPDGVLETRGEVDTSIIPNAEAIIK